jgi:GTP cyclohydrolase III
MASLLLPLHQKTQASPKSTRKELAAQERRRLEKRASRKSRGECTIAHLDIQHIDRKAASTQDIVTTWLQSNPKKTEVNHGSATRDIKNKYDHSAGIEKWLHLA